MSQVQHVLHTVGQCPWYAVLTRARHERKVYDQLVQKGIEAFFPTTQRWSRWRDRRKLVEWPLFPGYCFVRVAREEILPVTSCAGVAHVVSTGGHPAPIPDFEIDAIRRLVATTLQFDVWPFMKEGTLVEVSRGPLAGARGHLVQKGPGFNLLIGIEMLGRVLSVRVDASDVDRV